MGQIFIKGNVSHQLSAISATSQARSLCHARYLRCYQPKAKVFG
ncbi:hypothetical protein [Moorena producens]